MARTTVSNRREFLLAASLGAATAVAVAGTRRRGEDARTEAAVKPVDGYRVSPHIEKYYRTAGI